jgi:hypothetical protein
MQSTAYMELQLCWNSYRICDSQHYSVKSMWYGDPDHCTWWSPIYSKWLTNREDRQRFFDCVGKDEWRSSHRPARSAATTLVIYQHLFMHQVVQNIQRGIVINHFSIQVAKLPPRIIAGVRFSSHTHRNVVESNIDYQLDTLWFTFMYYSSWFPPRQLQSMWLLKH